MTPLLAAALLLAPPPEVDPAPPAAAVPAVRPGDGSGFADPAGPLPPPRVSADGVRTWADLPYRVAGGEPLRLDLALPPAGAGAGPAPLLVMLHGGGWVAGGKGRYARETVAAARRGYAAATVQYRLSGATPGGGYSAPFPAALEDVRAATAWLAGRADELNLDPARVGLTGDSAGGHLALLAAMTAGPEDDFSGEPPRARAAAVVNLFGVTDMPAYYTGSRHARAILSLFLGGHYATRREIYEAASPARFADAGDPPVLTLHGTADTVVPFDQAERLHAALDAAGVPNELVPVEGGRHGLWRQREDVRRRMYAFFDRLLKPAAPVR